MIIIFKMHVISSYPTIFLMWGWERANLMVSYRLQSHPPNMPQPWGLGRALRVEVNLIISPDTYNLILNLIKMHIFRKTNVSTRLHKNGHNFTCDQYLFVKLAPLDSAYTVLSIHAKNSVFMKNCKWSIFP